MVISPVVLGECGPKCAANIIAMVSQGVLHFVNEADQNTERFLDLLKHYNIGDGELESIAVCEKLKLPFCTDDRAARRLAASLLGPNNVTGSLGVLRRAVEGNVIKCDLAFESYGRMIDAGAYLPNLLQDFFCSGDNC